MAKEIYEGSIWKDRKRTIFGLPWSFTQYVLTDEKLLIIKGLFSRTEEEIRLYRIMDITLKRSLGERINRLGTIHCCSSDKTAPEFEIKHVKDSRKVKELLSDAVEKLRIERGLTIREEMSAGLSDSNHNGMRDDLER